MDSYRGFAGVYDLFMTKEIPYDAWTDYIDNILRQSLPTAKQGCLPPVPEATKQRRVSLVPDATKQGRVSLVPDATKQGRVSLVPDATKQGRALLVLDLACGTGNITLRLAARGYDMIGIDASEDMLIQAQNKAFVQGCSVLWLLQDMRALDLYGTVDAVVCTCDGLNYLLTPDALQEVFRRVRLFLNPGGVFIFDMNTEFKFKEVLGSGAFGDSAEGAEYQWDNHYGPASYINTYCVTFQVGDEVFTELHRQRAYDPAEVCNRLMEAGFGAVRMRDNYTDALPCATTTRITFIAN